MYLNLYFVFLCIVVSGPRPNKIGFLSMIIIVSLRGKLMMMDYYCSCMFDYCDWRRFNMTTKSL